MSDLQNALDAGDDKQVVEISSDFKEITKAARGSKSRVRAACRIFAIDESLGGDGQVAKWVRQKVAKSAIRGLWDVVRDHRQVDRFCDLLGELLMSGLKHLGPDAPKMPCVETLLLMHDPKALGFVLDEAEPNGNPGLLKQLARGGELRHEAERVKRFLNHWEGNHIFDDVTGDWILAKLGEERAYQSLVELCISGPMDEDNGMRAAQALSHIHQWDAPWGLEGIEIVRAKLEAKDGS